MYQQRFFRFERSKGKYVVPNRKQCLWQRGTAATIDVGWQEQRMVCSGDGNGGVATTLYQRCNAVSYFKAIDIMSNSGNQAGNLKP